MSVSYTLTDLERLACRRVPDGPHVVPEEVHDLWLAICGAVLHPTVENRARRMAAAERTSAAFGVSVDALLRFADGYAEGAGPA